MTLIPTLFIFIHAQGIRFASNLIPWKVEVYSVFQFVACNARIYDMTQHCTLLRRLLLLRIHFMSVTLTFVRT